MSDAENTADPGTSVQPARSGWQASIVAGIAAGVASVFGGWAVHEWRGSDTSIDGKLAKTASSINQTLPLMVDRWTRLESTMAMPGKRLVYNYRIFRDDTLGKVMADTEGFIQRLRTNAENTYETSVDMAWLRESEVTLVYRYALEDGEEFTRFEVTTD